MSEMVVLEDEVVVVKPRGTVRVGGAVTLITLT